MRPSPLRGREVWGSVDIYLGEFSSDLGDWTGNCESKDADGCQHTCCSSSLLPLTNAHPDVCPSVAGLANTIGLSIWREGTWCGGDFTTKSISMIPRPCVSVIP